MVRRRALAHMDRRRLRLGSARWCVGSRGRNISSQIKERSLWVLIGGEIDRPRTMVTGPGPFSSFA